MNKLAYTIQHLPPPGRRLEGGLALQLHRGRDLTILDCSRIDQPPSDVEMKTVAEAVVEAYHPAAIWLSIGGDDGNVIEFQCGDDIIVLRSPDD
jgi:hypothetical protein